MMSDGNPAPYFSPVSDLATAFGCQSLDTPRRRLSLDTDTSSGTPVISTPSPVIAAAVTKSGGGNATRQQNLETLIEGDAFDAGAIADKTRTSQYNISLSAASCRPRTNAMQSLDEAMIVDVTVSSAPAPPFLSVPLLVLPDSRPSSGSSGEGLRTPGVMISPAPSPVFAGDDDSRDSGYGGEVPPALGTTSSMSLRGEQYRKTALSDGWINAVVTQSRGEEVDDDGIFEAMQLDEKMDLAEIDMDAPLASLLQEKILYDGDKRAAVGRTPTESYSGTPMKRKMHVGRHTRCSADRQLSKDAAAVKRATDENDADHFDCDSDVDKRPGFKRRKSLANARFTSLREPLKPIINRCHSEADAFSGLHKDSSCHLIGDHSKPHALPIVDRPRVHDLTSISSDTLKRLMNGEFSHVVHGYTLVDCRYPYEYDGGHIKGSWNVYTQEELISRLLNGSVAAAANSNSISFNEQSTSQIYVFYCEFSQERGPRMARYLRKCDRQLNEYHYPKLFYPEIYLLDGGYNNFYATCSDLCEPQSYREMYDKAYIEDLRKFRCKSKSWCGGGAGGDPNDSQANSSSSTSNRRPGLNRGLFSSKGY